MIFYSHANVTHFHYKGFVLSLVLKVKGFGTRKWPIGLSRDLRHFKAFIIKKILEISKISLYVMTNLGEKWLIGRGMKQKCTKIAISWIHFVHPWEWRSHGNMICGIQKNYATIVVGAILFFLAYNSRCTLHKFARVNVQLVRHLISHTVVVIHLRVNIVKSSDPYLNSAMLSTVMDTAWSVLHLPIPHRALRYCMETNTAFVKKTLLVNGFGWCHLAKFLGLQTLSSQGKLKLDGESSCTRFATSISRINVRFWDANNPPLP